VRAQRGLPGGIDAEAVGEIALDGAVVLLHLLERRFEVFALHAQKRDSGWRGRRRKLFAADSPSARPRLSPGSSRGTVPASCARAGNVVACAATTASTEVTISRRLGALHAPGSSDRAMFPSVADNGHRGLPQDFTKLTGRRVADGGAASPIFRNCPLWVQNPTASLMSTRPVLPGADMDRESFHWRSWLGAHSSRQRQTPREGV
jgi:hypothetical protein